MRLRLATGVTGAAVVVSAIWLGAPWLTLLALLGGGLAVREVYRLTPPGVGRMPVVLGVIAVIALLVTAEASAGRDLSLTSEPLPNAEASSGWNFYAASGLALAAWAFAAVLWFIACYRGARPEPEYSPVEEDLGETGGPEEGPLPDGEASLESLSTSEEPDTQSSGFAADGEPGDGQPDAAGLCENPQKFEPGGEPGEYAGWGERPWFAFLFLLLGPVYVGFLLGHGLVIRDLTGDDGGDLGLAWLLFALLVVFACDCGAFAVGRLTGRHRMAPRISPNKTWEGAAGGLSASVGAALLVGLAFDLAVPLWQQAMIGAGAGIAAQAGDLAESALKRAANAKDSGSIMPGHGGILDRMDSILFALPAVYYMLLAAGLRL